MRRQTRNVLKIFLLLSLLIAVALVTGPPAAAGVQAASSDEAVAAGVPGTPTLKTPYNGSMTFTWAATSGATKYLLEVNSSASFASAGRKYFHDVGNVTAKTVSGLVPGTRYYWRLWAGNSAGWCATPKVGTSFVLGTVATAPTGIAVTYPTEPDVWSVGSTRVIKWNYSGGNNGTVNIDLVKASPAGTTRLATGVAVGSSGKGTWSWKIPANQTTGTDFKIKVTTNNGKTDSSDNFFEIKRAVQVEFRLSWNTDYDDIDAHFIKPGGTYKSPPGDCEYHNKGVELDWGTAGIAKLDLDDTNGYGPEVTTLRAATAAGTYQYKVYFYNDKKPTAGASTATVTVFINGVNKGTKTKALTEYQTWNLCSIDWTGSTGTITWTDTVTSATGSAIAASGAK